MKIEEHHSVLCNLCEKAQAPMEKVAVGPYRRRWMPPAEWYHFTNHRWIDVCPACANFCGDVIEKNKDRYFCEEYGDEDGKSV